MEEEKTAKLGEAGNSQGEEVAKRKNQIKAWSLWQGYKGGREFEMGWTKEMTWEEKGKLDEQHRQETPARRLRQ
ncbi:hypothetical protein Nepgr_004081 [Nepenthes gracilis]|uniref:Uncharacterized protein n=1 Tax=Nepenthes gracilis TaxID=150966 RepID=A0AAD3S0W5_NEPGR|nr:hypothetical protein Nepgr_004081 [Nepenthes gracilis]